MAASPVGNPAAGALTVGWSSRLARGSVSGLIRIYQWLISPWLAPSCRFVPSCSEYALHAIQIHGAVRGGWLAVRRLARCHPFGGSGLDEVPGHPTPDQNHCRCDHRDPDKSGLAESDTRLKP